MEESTKNKYNLSEQGRRSLSLAHLGIKHNPKTIEKIKIARKRQIMRKGWKHTEESKQKMSRSHEKIDKTTYSHTMEARVKLAGRERPSQCEICGALGRICFDHDHKTGKFRGWICQRCNVAIGMACDKIEILELLIAYLKSHNNNG